MHLGGILDNDGFRTGLAVGAVALVVVAALALLSNPSVHHRVPPLAGVAVVAASAIALDRAGPETLTSSRLIAGLILLVLGPFAAAISLGDVRAAPWVVALAAVPGAGAVAWAASADNDVSWVPALVLVSTVVGGALVADFDHANARAGLGPVLLAVALVGMYTTLPDTEQVVVVLGATLPIAVLGWPVAIAALGPGAYAAVGLLGWTAAIGGRGRPGAVVGAIACLGLMLVEPLVRRALRRRMHPPRRPLSTRTLLVIALQVGVVAVAARVAGLETSARTAAAVSAIALAGGAIGLAAVGAAPDPGPARGSRRSGRRTRTGSHENTGSDPTPPVPGS